MNTANTFLLLSEVISIARGKGKRLVNLSLAIHQGIAFFRKEWEGTIVSEP